MRRPKGAVSDELVPVYECVPSGTPLAARPWLNYGLQPAGKPAHKYPYLEW